MAGTEPKGKLTTGVEASADVGRKSGMARLRERGFRIAIDDLGAGYSGLTSFTRLAPDFVKLDMSLIRDVHKTPVKRTLVRFVTALCKDLGITVIAEGIEVVEERDTLVEPRLRSPAGLSARQTRSVLARGLPVSPLDRELQTRADFGHAPRTFPVGQTLARKSGALSPLSAADGKPPRIGTCEVYLALGTGGMATVYLGIHHGAHGFEKLVAVKQLLPEFRADPHYAAMLADEASVSAYTSHSCLRDVFDLGVAADGTTYLVMEFLVGEPLSRVRAAMRMQPDLLETKRHHRIAAHVIASCCEGVHAAHELSRGHAPLDVVHRDLTPENLFVLHDGTVRVTDFGIMRARTRRQWPSGEKLLKGKVGYMSPEYLRRAPYDRRTDVWSLGVVLWELLTGSRLFPQPRECDVAAAVLEGPIPPPSTERHAISRALDAIVARSVTRNVSGGRYKTADEMVQDLHAYLACEGVVGTWDVGAWLHQLRPDSLQSQTELIEAARLRRATPAPVEDDGRAERSVAARRA